MSDQETVLLDQAAIRKTLLTCLKLFDQYCTDHHLHYFLGGGTLLGAVRHKGFIPWDDDIDLMMKRDDYDRFIMETKESPMHPDFITRSPDSDEQYTAPFAQIVHTRTAIGNKGDELIKRYQMGSNGLFVDLFPIDGLPSARIFQLLHVMRIRLFKKLAANAAKKIWYIPPSCSLSVKHVCKLVGMIPVRMVSRVFGPRYFLKKVDRLSRRYPYATSDFVAVCCGSYGIREIVPKEVFAQSIEAEFEGSFFPIPIGYDLYLRNHYDDYLIIPTPEKQERHFFGDVYGKE